jgi:hypothetical protein
MNRHGHIRCWKQNVCGASNMLGLESVCLRVALQSVVQAKMLASASRSGSKQLSSASKSPSPSMSPTEQNIRQTLLRSARKKRGM